LTFLRKDPSGDEHFHHPEASHDPSLTVYADDGHATCWSDTMNGLYGIPTKRPMDPFGLWTWLCFKGKFSAARAFLISHGIPDRFEMAAINGVGLSSPSSLPSQPQEQTWPRLDKAALFGIPGEVVELFRPYSEADPVALLLSFLTGFGNAVGLRPHMLADGSVHRTNLFALLIGRTSKARKGTAWARSRSLLGLVDLVWMGERVKSGLSSGEGLITAVADEQQDRKGEVVAPAKDKRLLVIEEEFSRVLTVAHREGNSLSENIRQAWDGKDLATMTKTPLTAKSPHISIIGHITLQELTKKLTETEQANGFANRFLHALVTRSQVLADGGDPDWGELQNLARRIRKHKEAAARLGEVRRSADASARWAELYDLMAEDDEPGMVGAAAARVEAHTLRLSLVYALACGSSVVELDHLEAAWALWGYCRQSLDYIFGDNLGDEVADRLLSGLKAEFPSGVDRDAQYQLLGRHVPATRLTVATELLIRLGLATLAIEKTGGRDRQLLVYKEPSI
jgi:hypothetical protein